VCVCVCARACLCFVCVEKYVYKHTYIFAHANILMHIFPPTSCLYLAQTYGMATISRLLKITCLFCKRDLQKRLYSAKETYNFKEPTSCSHPIVISRKRTAYAFGESFNPNLQYPLSLFNGTW